LPVLVAGLLSFASLWHLWHGTGWPTNHESLSWGLRTLVYVRHFAWFDLLPIWSTADGWGFGSPQPLLYLKLFYLVAAVLATVSGSLKVGLVCALLVFLTAGAVGTYLTLHSLGATRGAALAAGGCLVLANYIVTNWLVRGALAEASAAMVVPWLFLFFSRTLQSGRMRVGLGVSIALLWLGHSVLAYFSVLLLGAAYVVLATSGAAPWSVLSPRAAWPAIAACLVLATPWLVPLAILGPDYDVSRILAFPYRPIH
jgi:hypothetical protein